MPTVVRDGRRVHFVRDGDGPGIVLVPGLGSGARLFGTLPRRFARAGFTCAAVDPPGLDPSDPLPATGYDFASAAADVLAVARELPRPLTLAGTSLGGKVALRAAALDATGIDRLVLLGTSVLPTARAQRVHRMFELLGSEVDERWLGELIAPFLFGETFLAQHAALVDDILRSMRSRTGARALFAAQVRALLAYDGRSDAAACSLPVLCLAGAEDTLTSPRDVELSAAAMGRARYQCIPGAGHSLLLESAQTFDVVAAFARAGHP